MHLEANAEPAENRAHRCAGLPPVCSREESGSTIWFLCIVMINVRWLFTDFQIVLRGTSNSWISNYSSFLKGCSRNLWSANNLARNQQKRELGKRGRWLQLTPPDPAEISLPMVALFDTLPCNLQQKDTGKTWKREAGDTGFHGALPVNFWWIMENSQSSLWGWPPLTLRGIDPMD